MVNVSGSSNVISKSKIMKVTEVMKTYDENGSRSELYLGQICVLMGIFFLRLHYFALRLGLLRLLRLLILGSLLFLLLNLRQRRYLNENFSRLN